MNIEHIEQQDMQDGQDYARKMKLALWVWMNPNPPTDEDAKPGETIYVTDNYTHNSVTQPRKVAAYLRTEDCLNQGDHFVVIVETHVDNWLEIVPAEQCWRSPEEHAAHVIVHRTRDAPARQAIIAAARDEFHQKNHTASFIKRLLQDLPFFK